MFLGTASRVATDDICIMMYCQHLRCYVCLTVLPRQTEIRVQPLRLSPLAKGQANGTCVRSIVHTYTASEMTTCSCLVLQKVHNLPKYIFFLCKTYQNSYESMVKKLAAQPTSLAAQPVMWHTFPRFRSRIGTKSKGCAYWLSSGLPLW